MKERYSEAALCGVALIGVLLYIHTLCQKLSAKHRGQKSYGGKSSVTRSNITRGSQQLKCEMVEINIEYTRSHITNVSHHNI